MNSEYIKVVNEEMGYGEKNLLQSQLALINIIKRYKNYESLRKEELSLKIHLKQKIEELKNDLSFFERLMPKVILQKDDLPLSQEEAKESMKKLSLEQELNAIKKRLLQLQD
jgi:hypothetical protein